MRSNTPEKQNSVHSVLITLLPPVLLIGFYACWLLHAVPAIIPAVCCSFLTLLLAFLLIRTSACYLDQISYKISNVSPGKGRSRSFSPTSKHPVLASMLFAALSRIALFIAVYAIHTAVYGYESGILQMSSLWNPPYSQGISCLNISNSWYAAADFPTSGYLPLFPLYPFLVSGINLLTGNRFLSGLILSFFCFVFASGPLYSLVLADYGSSSASRAVRYLCLLPPTFLLNLPAADALFLLLSVLTLFFARKHRFYPAAAAGALAASTSLAGVLLFVPVLFELLMYFREERAAAIETVALVKATVPKFLASLLVPAATFFCINLIERRSGIPFPLFNASSDLPNTGLAPIFQNFSTEISDFLRMVSSDATQALYGYVLPNLICFVAVPFILLFSVRKIRLSYTVYGICYYLLVFSFGNLVSAPRYSILCVPALIGLSVSLNKKIPDFLFSVLSIVLLAGYLYAFTLQWGVF